MKITHLALPAYSLEKEPDFQLIGSQIEAKIGEEFSNQYLAMRGISLKDHPGKSPKELESLILKYGTDRYDPNRKGVQHEIDEEYGIELHAVSLRYDQEFFCHHYQHKYREGHKGLAGFLEDFYHGAKIGRKDPLRIDLLLFYDLNKLEAAPMRWSNGWPVKTHRYINPIHATDFRFKDTDRKQEALVGLLHLGK
ncbi:MAG: hypothetical protein AAFR87_01515 [Bacteroidota bacterium]